MDKKKEKIAVLERQMTEPAFWEDSQKARQVSQEVKQLKETISNWHRFAQEVEDLQLLNELALSENDSSLSDELSKNLEKLTKDVTALETKSYFSEEFDARDAILSIHPGAGGTESQDWAEMLLRMYLRWAERQGYSVEINDILAGEEAGIKRVTVTVTGTYAFGILKAEKGIHRLVRISPFDASKRRHTSFASVDVIPLIDEEVEISIDPSELRIETYRASGPGGQHVNVTDSAVRITHVPTGVTAQCQSERSQLRNKNTALTILKARLYQKIKQEKEEELAEIRGKQEEIAWGSQIRSYVLHPYQMVKDHRTGVEKGNAYGVLDGDIDEFIHAYHRRSVESKGS